MKEQIRQISKDLEGLIQIKELELTDIVKDIPPIISILEDGFDRLKSVVCENEFADKSDEILFFKEIKPRLFNKLIYYKKVYNIEIHRPVCSYNIQKAYFEKEQETINEFYKRHIEFIQYYRSGKTILDEYYFMRGRHDIELNLESFYFERDPKFSTNYDFKVAKILASDMLAAHLNQELIKLKQNEYQIDNRFNVKSNEKWTDTKSALVELLYAIHAEQSVNSGNIDLKVLAAIFEKTFNIELGDIYRMFLEIRGRKGCRTLYLNRLIDALNKRMDDADGK